MKNTLIALFGWLLLATPAAVHAQFTYITTNGTITITGYTGTNDDVIIPSTIDGLPVTSIGDNAFFNCRSLTSVTIGNGVTSIGWGAFEYCTRLINVMIPNSVTNIGDYAFSGCPLTSITIPNSVTSIGDGAFSSCLSLTNIVVDPSNSAYSSLNGVLFDKGQTMLIQYPEGNVATSYTIPNSVTNIGDGAFYDCTSLTSITIPNSVTSIGDSAFNGCSSLVKVIIGSGVTNIGDQAFSWCTSLSSVYFQGNAPGLGSAVFSYYVFFEDGLYGKDLYDPATVYYPQGTTGWDAFATNSSITNSGIPIAVWQHQIETTDISFGVRTNQFGFNINWASGMTVVVEASTSLSGGAWTPLQTNTLSSSSFYFSDPEWTKYPSRFYRVRSP